MSVVNSSGPEPIERSVAFAGALRALDLGSGRLSAALRSAVCSLSGLYWLMCLASIMPLLAIDHPKLVDYPNHLARLFIECHRSDPDIAHMYAVRLAVIPNLVTDLLNMALCGLVGPKHVLIGTVLLAQAVIFIALRSIQRTLHGENNALILFIPALSFNLMISMGYVNYLAGVALAFALLALLIKRPFNPARTILLCNAMGTAIVLSHVFSLALIMAIIFFVRYSQAPSAGTRIARAARAAAATLACFVLPLLVLSLTEPQLGKVIIGYEAKLRVLTAPFTFHHLFVDSAIALFVLCGTYTLWRDGRLTLARPMKGTLVGLFAICLVIPSSIREVVDIDARLAAAGALLLLACARPVRCGKNLERAIILGAVAILAIRLVTTMHQWVLFDRDVKELRLASSILPARAKVLSVAADPSLLRDVSQVNSGESYWHLASYVTIDRRSFNPLNFVGKGMQPLEVAPEFAHLESSPSLPVPVSIARLAASREKEPQLRRILQEHGKPTYFLRWPENFDYVIFYHYGDEPNFDPLRLQLLRQGSFFSILAVRKA